MITDLVCDVIRAIGFVDPRVSRAMQCNHGGHTTRQELSREITPDGMQYQIEATSTTRHGTDVVITYPVTVSGQSGPPNPAKILK